MEPVPRGQRSHYNSHLNPQSIPRASPAPASRGAGKVHSILGNVFSNVYEIMAGKKQTQLIFLNWSQRYRKPANSNSIPTAAV